ncbi:tail fiber assembly protein [Citrobacter sp. RHB21-C05]|uniref:tail fiber assembly protein n=1 Tax=unclassified Citrobacter TaxID=2644389 RepID=UPI0015E90F5D|nr:MULTISPECIES: tail fiber assembly protein [unclassified Citrobacter]EIQ7160029.1 tail fiber assembly protein [Citrobacter sedlakii]QMK45121.1 tail fiber assembly protein [Citrobacter sp. RHB21-C05]QMK63565.1 tail fiber assembly protein [Citrobacter sp. RHB21-C01]
MSEEIKYYFSASNNSFYPLSLKDDYDVVDSWPSDAVAISEKWYNYLMEGQMKGKLIISNEYGEPILSEPAPLTKQELIQFAENKKEELLREIREKTQIWQTQLALGIISDEDRQRLIQWMLHAQQVAVTDTSANPVDWPEQPR